MRAGTAPPERRLRSGASAYLSYMGQLLRTARCRSRALGALLHAVPFTTLCAQSLTNPGFEGSFSTTAAGWTAITYGSPFPSVVYSPESDQVHGGLRAQRIDVGDLGGGATLLAQALDFPAGNTYRASVWLRAAAAMKVAVYLQERVPYYWVPAVRLVNVDTAWVQVVIEGGFDRDIPDDAATVPGRLVVEPRTTGSLIVDDAAFADISAAVWNAPVTLTDSIPPYYFGMHVNKWGQHETWPPTHSGMLRLWNTGTTWEIMEPWEDALLDPADWIYDPGGTSGFAFRLQYYVDMVQDHDTTMRILYTMGQSPPWAAPSPTLPPADPAAWQQYAAVLGDRFLGRIGQWEIWNEVDQQDYSGTMEDLVQLTDSAAATLRALDPANLILSPNFTGPERLANFLELGGANAVDAISWHHYPSRRPEEMVPEIIGMRHLMAFHGLEDKPLWNTEGAVSFMNGLVLPEEEQAAAVARAYLVQWSFGVSNFNWYAWDIHAGWSSDFVDLSYSIVPGQYDGNTAAGLAYAHTAQWLTGATMVQRSVTDGTWVIGLARPGGVQAWVVWHPDGPAVFDVPLAWNIGHVHDLSGGTTSFGGGMLTIGIAPLLLESGTGSTIAERAVTGGPRVVPQPMREHALLIWDRAAERTVHLFDPRGGLLRTYAKWNGRELNVAREGLAPGVYPFVVEQRDAPDRHGRLIVAP